MNPTQPTVTGDLNPGEILDRAADYIDHYGWIQGALYAPATLCAHPATCALGAIAITSYGHPEEEPSLSSSAGSDNFHAATEWLSQHLHRHHHWHHIDADASGLTVARWNDQTDTTGADVTDAMRAAAGTWRTEFAGGER